jgi:hypothetical protein
VLSDRELARAARPYRPLFHAGQPVPLDLHATRRVVIPLESGVDRLQLGSRLDQAVVGREPDQAGQVDVVVGDRRRLGGRERGGEHHRAPQVERRVQDIPRSPVDVAIAERVVLAAVDAGRVKDRDGGEGTAEAEGAGAGRRPRLGRRLR